MTLAELKARIALLPDTDPDTGEPYEVWMEVGDGLSSEVKSVWPLNKGDILFSTEELT